MLRFEPTYNRFGHRHLLSRAAAFEAQGVTLADPRRSWSGLRSDGSVVFAIHESEVHEQEDGFCSLLFATGADVRPGPAADPHRLAHCRMALAQGGATGLLAVGLAGKVRGNSVLVLSLREREGEFWATWGAATRSLRLPVVEETVPFQRRAPCWAERAVAARC